MFKYVLGSCLAHVVVLGMVLLTNGGIRSTTADDTLVSVESKPKEETKQVSLHVKFRGEPPVASLGSTANDLRGDGLDPKATEPSTTSSEVSPEESEFAAAQVPLEDGLDAPMVRVTGLSNTDLRGILKSGDALIGINVDERYVTFDGQQAVLLRHEDAARFSPRALPLAHSLSLVYDAVRSAKSFGYSTERLAHVGVWLLLDRAFDGRILARQRAAAARHGLALERVRVTTGRIVFDDHGRVDFIVRTLETKDGKTVNTADEGDKP